MSSIYGYIAYPMTEGEKQLTREEAEANAGRYTPKVDGLPRPIGIYRLVAVVTLKTVAEVREIDD